MNRPALLAALLLATGSLHANGLQVFPPPHEMTRGEDDGFTLDAHTRLLHDADDATARAAAEACAAWLRPLTGLPLPVQVRQEDDEPTNALSFAIDGEVFQGGAESYELASTGYQIDLLGGGAPGLRHALRTLRQLLVGPATNGAWRVPACDVADAPGWRWRGVLLARPPASDPEGTALVEAAARWKLNAVACPLSGCEGFPPDMVAAAAREGVLLLALQPVPPATTNAARVLVLPEPGPGDPPVLGTDTNAPPLVVTLEPLVQADAKAARRSRPTGREPLAKLAARGWVVACEPPTSRVGGAVSGALLPADPETGIGGLLAREAEALRHFSAETWAPRPGP